MMIPLGRQIVCIVLLIFFSIRRPEAKGHYTEGAELIDSVVYHMAQVRAMMLAAN